MLAERKQAIEQRAIVHIESELQRAIVAAAETVGRVSLRAKITSSLNEFVTVYLTQNNRAYLLRRD
jgi:hypothetical protein